MFMMCVVVQWIRIVAVFYFITWLHYESTSGTGNPVR